MAGWSCDNAETNEWDGTLKAKRLQGDGSQITNIPSVPIGTITMFGGAVAPTGWVLCDNSSLLRAGTYAALFAVIGTTFGSADGTHFNVPDMRGIFPRGAGTSAKLTNANGTAFAGTLGTYQNDMFQGHYHEIHESDTSSFIVRNLTVGSTGTTTYQKGSSSNTRLEAQVPIADTTNGAPRTGAETNPANLAVNFIIKY
jgi:microcystin-dependent protein